MTTDIIYLPQVLLLVEQQEHCYLRPERLDYRQWLDTHYPNEQNRTANRKCTSLLVIPDEYKLGLDIRPEPGVGDSLADNLADSPDYKGEACNLCCKSWPCSERKQEKKTSQGEGLSLVGGA